MAKKKKKTGSLLPETEEILTEILIRLPVKSILQCKSVSKPWLSIISNPHFTKTHLQRVITSSHNNPTLLNFLNPSPVNNLPPLNDDVLLELLYDEETFLKAIQLDYDADMALHDANGDAIAIVMPTVFGESRVVGTTSCNGIICLANDYRNTVYLWNPCIRKCKQLHVPESITISRSSQGFGYDSISDDYKFFMVLHEKILDGVRLIVKVYSTNADTWTEFQGPILKKNLEEKVYMRNNNIVVNGILYFGNRDGLQLISFHLHKEVFGLVPFPSFVRRKWSDVLDFKGSVAMVFESGQGIDLWTLDHVSWTKAFSIQANSEFNMWLSCYLGASQFYGKKLLDGRLVMYNNVLYDCEKKETKYYELGEHNVRATLKYTDTLVSLDGFQQVEENAN